MNPLRPFRSYVLAAIFMVMMAMISNAIGAARAADTPPLRYPTLIKQAAAVEAFVPAGWVLETTATGDLNADRRPDKVLVLRQTEVRNGVNNNGLGVDRLDTNSRVLSGKMRTTIGSLTTEATQTTWQAIPAAQKICLDQIGDGFAFDPQTR